MANIVNAALDAGVKKKNGYVSSVAALGRIRQNEPITELMNWTEETSNSAYGQSKYLAEMEVWRGIAEGLDAVMVNPTIILGAGNWNEGSTKIFQNVYNEFPWYAEGTTGFVDKRCGLAMVLLMDSDISGQRFILSAENRSYKEVLYDGGWLWEKTTIKKLPLFISACVAAGSHQKLVLQNQIRSSPGKRLKPYTKARFDNSKLPKFLPGFCFTGPF